MTALHRARLMLVVALFASILALVFWFPLGTLVHQRSSLGALSSELSSVQSRNAALRSEIAGLGSDADIETIAHEDYGLVRPGQRSYVILPAAGSSVGAPGLRETMIPPSDLVADEPTVAPSAHAAAAEPSFWSRFTSHLEFWH